MPTLVNNLRAIRGPVTAVPVVGQSGVVVEPDTQNNQVVVRADETVLWEGSAGASDTITLSESPMNFERIKIFYGSHTRSDGTINANTKDVGVGYTEFMPDETNTVILETLFLYDPTTQSAAGTINHGVAAYYNTMTTTWTRIISAWSQGWFNGGGTIRTDFNFVYVHKIIGINRIANN